MSTTSAAWLITLGLFMIVTGVSMCVTGWNLDTPKPVECQAIGEDEARVSP
jgi:hypothetical protein